MLFVVALQTNGRGQASILESMYALATSRKGVFCHLFIVGFLLLCAFKNECGFNGSVFTLAVGFQYSGVKVKAPISPHPFSMYGHISGQYIIGALRLGIISFADAIIPIAPFYCCSRPPVYQG